MPSAAALGSSPRRLMFVVGHRRWNSGIISNRAKASSRASARAMAAALAVLRRGAQHGLRARSTGSAGAGLAAKSLAHCKRSMHRGGAGPVLRLRRPSPWARAARTRSAPWICSGGSTSVELALGATPAARQLEIRKFVWRLEFARRRLPCLGRGDQRLGDVARDVPPLSRYAAVELRHQRRRRIVGHEMARDLASPGDARCAGLRRNPQRARVAWFSPLLGIGLAEDVPRARFVHVADETRIARTRLPRRVQPVSARAISVTSFCV